jgi:hypothetical protein
MAEGPTRPPPGSTPARGRGQPRDVARRLGTLPRARGGLGARGPATSRGPSGPSVGGLWHAAGLPAPLSCQPAVGPGSRSDFGGLTALESLCEGSGFAISANGCAPQAGAVGSAIALLHALLSLPLMRPEFAPLTREQGSPRTTPSYPAEGEAQVVTNLACARGSSTPRSAVRVVPPILGEGTEEEVDWQGHLAALAGRFPREHCSVRRHGFLRRLRPLLRSTSPSASFV